jgi:thiamine biosynthesis lipoprotein
VDRALGVSGTGEQHFTVDGKRYGHILDARTGWPVVDRAYVAVVAPTAAQADALATAFFVGGPAIAEAYVRSHPEVSVLMMDMLSDQTPAPPRFIGDASPWSLTHGE